MKNIQSKLSSIDYEVEKTLFSEKLYYFFKELEDKGKLNKAEWERAKRLVLKARKFN